MTVSRRMKAGSTAARGRKLGADTGGPSALRTLFLLRHAKAVPADEADDDEVRALATRGRSAARTLAGHFRGAGLAPDLVLCSPSARTRETLELVRTGFAKPIKVETNPALYLADWPVILEAIRAVPEDVGTVMVVGHNPGLHELAMSLAVMAPREQRAKLARKFPTGALVRFAVERPWGEFNRASINLVEYLTPADLDAGVVDEN
jgi:phosphohistidine phosphatase